MVMGLEPWRQFLIYIELFISHHLATIRLHNDKLLQLRVKTSDVSFVDLCNFIDTVF